MTKEEAIKEAYGIPVNKKQHEALQILIPELAESEDERIRKILIHIVKGACGKYGIKYKGDEITEEKLIAYIEKQKDPTEGIKGNSEEIPSNVDLEKELQAFLCNYDYEFDDDAPAYDIARHFYELGLNARKEK